MIDGVIVSRPRTFTDARGAVMRMLRTDDPHFLSFGEMYFSTVNPGVVKGWKRHRRMTMNLACPAGRVLLVLYDDRPNSPTCGMVQEIAFSPDDYAVVTVPPMVWNAFAGLGEAPSVLANCASIPHDPDESDRADLNAPPVAYIWPTP